MQLCVYEIVSNSIRVTENGHIRRIKIGLGELLLAVVVRAPKNRASPVCKQALGLSLDRQLGALALDVEHDDFPDSRCNKSVLVDR